MLGIVLCDDDRFMLRTSADIVDGCIRANRYDAQVVCRATDAREMLRFLAKNPQPYLHFLDLDFGSGNLNGLDIARQIKARAPLSRIVFVTGHGDRGMDILKSGIEPFGFIEKTADASAAGRQFQKYIAMALEREEGRGAERAIELVIGIDERVSIPVSQVVYVESIKTLSHFIRYHTVDGSCISVRGTVEQALAKLGAGFLRCHRGIIINRAHVVAMDDGMVRVASGEAVPCAFRQRGVVQRECLGR